MISVKREDVSSLPEVEFIAHPHSPSLLSPVVDPSAASLVPPHVARAAGIMPFAWEDGTLAVAVADHVSPYASQVLEALEPVTLYRTTRLDLAVTQDTVYHNLRHAQRLGELAVALGYLHPADLKSALAIQRQTGGKLGQICVAHQWLTAWELAQVLAYQNGIPAVNLLERSLLPHHLFSRWDKEHWYRYQMVPISETADELVVAIEDPTNFDGVRRLSEALSKRVRPVITGHRDIHRALTQHYAAQDLDESVSDLLRLSPEDCAESTLTRAQKRWVWAIAAVIGLGFLADAGMALTAISSVLVLIYGLLVGYRLWLIYRGADLGQAVSISPQQLAQLDDRTLPPYTILVPLRDEARVLESLVKAIERIDYPKDRLDVKLVLEADDAETIRAAYAAQLPRYMDIVVVPPQDPRTKPKACNFALKQARGRFVTIYDAEDLPEPDQLKKAVVAFAGADDKLACVQAKLSYFNANQNLLTRWFTAEYGAWFDVFLPSLYAASLPIPLGGTSNHFRTEVLRELGAWDPFNVTEDADLGIRLSKRGYRTAVLDSVTYEEANSEFVNWVRQRSRWIKGYLQTWLVHMRQPRRLYRQLGRRGFWGFQLAVLATPLMFLLNPLYWFITSLWFLTHWNIIPQMFPPGVYYIGMLNLLVGNFAFAYLNAIGSAKRGNWGLVPYALLTPIYWSMMSLAAWKALIQLISRPFHWEKTMHGLTRYPLTRAASPPGRSVASTATEPSGATLSS